MSATVYRWIIVYEDGYVEEKDATSPCEFADDLVEVPIAIIRSKQKYWQQTMEK